VHFVIKTRHFADRHWKRQFPERQFAKGVASIKKRGSGAGRKKYYVRMSPKTVGEKSSVMGKDSDIKGETRKDDIRHSSATSPIGNKNKNNFFSISLGNRGSSVINNISTNDSKELKHDTKVKQVVSSVSSVSNDIWMKKKP